MPPESAEERTLSAARDSGLVVAGEPLLVLVSAGADSVCLLDVTARLGARVRALHVNYGLREGAAGDEELCRSLCERLGLPLHVERAELGEGGRDEGGNLQARAREIRYAHAERLVRGEGGDYAAAHTASDQAETVLYRLAVSPGTRALLGMSPRRGRLVRPLLRATRTDTHGYCAERGLEWREDPSNVDRRFARARVREDLLPLLRSLNPAAERAIVETSLLLRDEAEVLERQVDESLGRLAGTGAISLADLRSEPPALARLVLRRLAEAAAGRPVSLGRDQTDAILDLGPSGSRALDLGDGLRAIAEYGTLRFASGGEAEPPEPAVLPVPGVARFGPWEVKALLGAPGEVTVSAAALGASVTIRSWREGDRMRPIGAGGSKSLQDVFTDRKVPRALRRSLPVVEVAGEIAWVAGVALDERFAAKESLGSESVGLTARRVS